MINRLCRCQFVFCLISNEVKPTMCFATGVTLSDEDRQIRKELMHDVEGAKQLDHCTPYTEKALSST